ncbi:MULTISPECIES: hypothetical protein [unclassified Salipiger]|uniref:hypothetical protein n=1 Tax=unclassified Salipiger TaxID=2640570 RepID=UPI0013B78B29|nr:MULTISPECIES: hypothetical protein [unclassified Salipiger]NDV49313.1 hypothetical protein [Salipiger sp. PrR003]NDW32785.1 hypothetical protein [Salipiger sp. PrR007]
MAHRKRRRVHPSQSAEPDRLRQRIDHGETGDKVNFSDPAAAPLGTDAEAGAGPSATPAGKVTVAPSVPEREKKRSPPHTPAELQNSSSGRRGIFLVFLVVLAGIVALVAFV